jgi:hypothetical protein
MKNLIFELINEAEELDLPRFPVINGLYGAFDGVDYSTEILNHQSILELAQSGSSFSEKIQNNLKEYFNGNTNCN